MITKEFQLKDDETIIPFIVKTAEVPTILIAFKEAFNYQSTIVEEIEEEYEEDSIEIQEVEVNGEMTFVNNIVPVVKKRTVQKQMPNPQTIENFAKEQIAKYANEIVKHYLSEQARKNVAYVPTDLTIKL